MSGTSGLDGWYLGPVTVTLSAADPLSGVAATQYRLDGGAWLAYAGPLVIGDGVHAVDYRSTDAADNVEPFRTLLLQVDEHHPVISAVTSTGRLKPEATGSRASETLAGLNAVADGGVAAR